MAELKLVSTRQVNGKTKAVIQADGMDAALSYFSGYFGKRGTCLKQSGKKWTIKER